MRMALPFSLRCDVIGPGKGSVELRIETIDNKSVGSNSVEDNWSIVCRLRHSWFYI